ncbi:glycosyl transferase family 2 [Catenulispora acidiphila DSM 44928]|uniref:Glycosyl transferase family 2 n=1 Tax=Catenulispora acidiphila (strain DSM 44928 / JCM 14897 / NBRC 102108 / NRRL B-24433 / ID139908) TaxID=479433 RepID=C7QIW3_CATAD|nr:glycosyltransferase [Catenulispora acidiphila]ACU77013.1 glycosyl transferase family 2 [Catenulispora acidiphila DSM 44928]
MVDLRVTAVFTAYHPDERLAAAVEAALRDCTSVIIVDNTPAGTGGGAPASTAPALAGPRVTVIDHGRNVGLGAALNLAVRELPGTCEAVLFLDQDSELPPEIVPGLVADLADAGVGIAAPSPWDPKHQRYYCSDAKRNDSVSDEEAVITSGMLVRREVLEKVPFNEDMFLDWVDVAFCLDVRRAGWRIVIDWRLRLPHEIGACEVHTKFGRTVHYSHYPAFRLYWIGRNVSILHRGHFESRPRALASTLIFMAQRFTTTLLFEPQRRTHVPALLRGFRDGLRERVDPRYLPAGAEHPAVRRGADARR